MFITWYEAALAVVFILVYVHFFPLQEVWALLKKHWPQRKKGWKGKLSLRLVYIAVLMLVSLGWFAMMVGLVFAPTDLLHRSFLPRFLIAPSLACFYRFLSKHYRPRLEKPQ